MQVTHPSPNRNARPKGQEPTLIVLHSTAGASDRGDVAWCCDPRAKVSYHAIVGRTGEVFVLVPFHERAWHAGVSEWQGRSNVNDFSLGLAFSNRHDGKEPLTRQQMDVMRGLVQGIRQRLPGIRVVTHGMVAPGRKDDPSRSPGFALADYTDAPLG